MLATTETTPPQLQNASILIVEDNHHDALLLIHALKALRPEWIPMTVTDGDSALRWLTRCASHEEDLPFAIVLDLSLPGMDGQELLAWIDAQRHLDKVKTIVVSGHVRRPTGVRSPSGRFVTYLPKPVSAFAIAAALTAS